MSFQRRFRRQNFAAMRANQIGFIMPPHVSVVFASQIKRLLTRFTGIHGRPVNLFMFFQHELRHESLRTLRAMQNLFVYIVVGQFHVALHQRNRHEAFFAMRTNERFLT